MTFLIGLGSGIAAQFVMNARIRKFSFGIFLVTSLWCSGSVAEDTKQMKLINSIDFSELSPRAKRFLATYRYRTVEQIVRSFVPSYYSHSSSNKRYIEEVLLLIKNHKLRLGMTDSEIGFFNRYGYAPEVGPDSSVRVLNIDYAGIFGLENSGAKTLGEINKVSLAQLREGWRVGPKTANRVAGELIKLGYPLREEGSNCETEFEP